MEDVMSEVPEMVAQEAPTEVPTEAPAEVPDLQTAEIQPEAPVPKERLPRVRKVSIKEPAPQPLLKTPHEYWGDRLEEHRSNQRVAKDERYGNLRIM